LTAGQEIPDGEFGDKEHFPPEPALFSYTVQGRSVVPRQCDDFKMDLDRQSSATCDRLTVVYQARTPV